MTDPWASAKQPETCRWCLIDIAQMDGKWQSPWGGGEEPPVCVPGHEHEPITDWGAFWRSQRERAGGDQP